MNCLSIQQLIDDHLEANGDLSIFSVDDHQNLAEHLETCAQCHTYFNRVAIPLVDARDIPSPPLPEGLKSRIARSMSQSTRRSRLSYPGRLAAVFSLCVVCFILGYQFRSKPEPFQAPPQSLAYKLEGDQCHFTFSRSINPLGYYRSANQSTYDIILSNRTQIKLSRDLDARGRFQLDTRQIKLSETEACMAFFSPLGESLVLHLTKKDTSVCEPFYSVTKDPDKVLGHTVTWRSGKWECSISGRLPPEYLLEFAEEINIQV